MSISTTVDISNISGDDKTPNNHLHHNHHHLHLHHRHCHHQHQPSIYRGRHRLALSNEGPYFFRSLVSSIYRSGQYSDFTIRVQGSSREFCVHRAVVCPQSGIFEAACRGQFIESTTNSITLTDDDPEIVERMIRYLYTHRYDDAEDWSYGCCDNGIKRIKQHYLDTAKYDENDSPAEHTFQSISSHMEETIPPAREEEAPAASIDGTYDIQTGDYDPAILHNIEKSIPSLTPSEPPKSLYVYAIADKYLVYPLKDLARIRFSNWVYSHWWTKGFVAAAREIFDNETGNYNDLKEVILSTIVLHADTLLCGGNGYSNGSKNDDEDGGGEIYRFMQDYNEVSVEVLRRTLDRTRIRQRGLEVDIADLESRVSALRIENKKIAILQGRNNSLNKELLDIKMVVLAWKRDLKNSSTTPTRTSTSSNSARQDRRGRSGVEPSFT